MFLPFRGRNAVTGLDLHFSSFSRKKNGDRTRSAFFSPSAGEKNRGRHQFLNWCRQVSAGHLHFDGFSPGQDQKREEGITFLSFLVPVTGLEPVRCRQRWILSPLRLPFHHTGRLFFLLIQWELGRLRCPISSSAFISHRQLSTAAHRSGRFFRHRRRSHRSPSHRQVLK